MEKANIRELNDDVSLKIKRNLKQDWEDIKELHQKQIFDTKFLPGREVARKRSEAADRLIEESMVHLGFSSLRGISIVALGGYGREELCPHSDIDLLFLYKPQNDSLAEKITESLLYLLWDLNLEIGHSIRKVDECIELSQGQDSTILTSLLDGRFLFGDNDLYNEFEERLFGGLLPRISSRFIERKVEEVESRRKRFGGSLYILEPNVKEGEGGLRDIHSSLWISQAKFKVKSLRELLGKGILIEKELEVFERGLDFLLHVRSELHYLAGRREDRLSFDFQENVANFLGYKDAKITAVERFMRAYYLRANQIKEHSNKLIERCVHKQKPKFRPPRTVYLEGGFIIQGGELSVSNRDIFRDRPESFIKAFELADRHEVKLSKYLSDLIRDNVNIIDEEVRKNSALNASFIRLLNKGKNVAEALFEMNRLRVLSHYIPEFGQIVCMVQHDAYHVYTVDVHTIFMIKEIENLLTYKYDDEFPLLTKVAESLTKRHVLYISILLHDIGKGQGRSHSQKGAAMVSEIAQRIGLSREDTEQIEFLVKHHLVMPHFSQRRDIHDHTLINRFAKSVRNFDTLSHLYLLTFADIRSVGPDVWSNWKGMLLRELYLRTAKALETVDFDKESTEERAERVASDIVSMLTCEIPEDKVRRYLEQMPDSYFWGFSRSKIAYHLSLIQDSGDDVGMDVIYHPEEDYDEFTFWGFDERGIFSKLCGVIAASGLNILGARIVTRDDGRILDVFYTNRLGKSTHNDTQIWERTKENLRQVLAGSLDVDELVSRRKKNTQPVYKKPIPKEPTRIEIDNELSELSTVVDVYTHDRVGLLYDITKTLNDLGLTVDYAKVSTKVDQVTDTFYVRSLGGGKVLDTEKLDEIKKALLEAIDSGT